MQFSVGNENDQDHCQSGIQTYETIPTAVEETVSGLEVRNRRAQDTVLGVGASGGQNVWPTDELGGSATTAIIIKI